MNALILISLAVGMSVDNLLVGYISLIVAGICVYNMDARALDRRLG